jgi:hypothetical protein
MYGLCVQDAAQHIRIVIERVKSVVFCWLIEKLQSMDEKFLWIIPPIRYIEEPLGEGTNANDRIRTRCYFYFAIWGA